MTLAKARSKTFSARKLVLTSTPTVKGASRIDEAYEESDQRRFWVPCPHCGEHQVLAWRQVRWEENRPDTARYLCEHCGAVWNDGDRLEAIGRGEWRAERAFAGIAGFALSELYSPWSRLAEMARACVDAKASRSSERIRAWTNTTLGESYEEDAERLDETGLAERAETWDGVPEPVLLTTIGIDVQDDRLEMELVGWGDREESWSLDYRVLFGDPAGPALWEQLAAYLAEHKPAAACIDSGGHHTGAVYNFVRGRYRQRVFAIKGMAGGGRPVWPKTSNRSNVGKVNLFAIGVDAAKQQIYSQLKLRTPGPGFCHFPKGRDDQYFAGLASEVVRTRYHKGFPVREWIRRSGVRNEPLDCRVYAYAALCSLNVQWRRLAVRRQKAAAEPQETAAEPQLPTAVERPAPGTLRTQAKALARTQPRRRGGWVGAW